MIPSYPDLYTAILRGPRSSPRGEETHEVYNATILFRPGEMPDREGINHRLGLMEGLMFVAGMFKPDWIQAVAPKARLDLFTEQAAYGPRTRDQFPAVENILRRDPQSRRAVVNLARASEAGMADMPCTISLAFSLRNGTLNTTVFMRSSDAIWGLPYDIVQFGLVAQVLAAVLKVQARSVCLYAANMHIYQTTQHLRPTGRGGSFQLAAVAERQLGMGDWFDAQDWAFEQAIALAEVGRANMVEVNHA